MERCVTSRDLGPVVIHIELTHLPEQPTSEEEIRRAGKTAPLPEGLNEVHDGVHSGGGSRGIPASGSGKGGHEPKTLGEEKGLHIERKK